MRQSAPWPITRDEVKKPSDYRQHAEECRILGKQVSDGTQRNQPLEMTRTWVALAEDRDKLAQNHPEAKAPDRNKGMERTA
jgi:hypothetical protein